MQFLIRFVIGGLVSVGIHFVAPDVHAFQEENEAANTCSIFESTIANCSTWVSGDFLVRESLVIDATEVKDGNPVGELIQKTKLTRVVFDSDEESFAYFTTSIGNKISFPSETVKPIFGISGWIGNYKNKRFGRFVNGHGFTDRTREYPNIEAMLNQERFPDFRAFCFFQSPRAFSKFKDNKSILQMSKGINYLNSRVLGSKQVITFDTGIPIRQLPGNDRFKDSRVIRRFKFDTEKLVPIRTEVILQNIDSEKTIGEFQIDWKEIGGVQLPFRSSKTQNKHLPGSNLTGKQNQEFEFHWFKFNEPVDTDLFAIKNVKSKQQILDLVDPDKTNATDLTEKSDNQ